MNYFEHNDRKGRDARRAVEINKAERARMREPWDGALYMARDSIKRRRIEAYLKAPTPARMGWTFYA